MGWLLLFGLAFAIRAAYLLELRGSVLVEVLIGDGYGYGYDLAIGRARWPRATATRPGRTFL